MKDSMRAKIDEARAEGRDVPLVMEELLMHLADGMDGHETAKKPEPAKLPNENATALGFAG